MVIGSVVVDAHIRSAVAGLRGLGRAGIPAIALGPSWNAAGRWSRYAAGRALAPDPKTDRAGFAAALAQLAQAHGPLVAYPGREESIDGILAASRIASSVIAPFPHEAVERIRRKSELDALAAESGLRVPATLEEATAAELLESSLPLPCAIKPIISTGPLATTHVIASRDELRELLCVLPPDERLIVQPQIRSALTSLGLVISRGGRLVARFQHLATRTWPRAAGSTASAVSVRPDERLMERAARMLSSAGYWGIVEMEFLDDGDGPTLIDVNPRYYGCLALPLRCGVNLPAAWHAVATDGPLPEPQPYLTGVGYRWLEADMVAAVRGAPQLLTRRPASPGVGAMWAADDPLAGPLLAATALSGRVRNRVAKAGSRNALLPLREAAVGAVT